jgi:hypothetical protein
MFTSHSCVHMYVVRDLTQFVFVMRLIFHQSD